MFSEKKLWLDTWLIPLKDDDNKISFVLGISRDITDRMQIQEALQKSHDALEHLVEKRTTQAMKASEDLRESQRRQKALLDSIPDMAWIKDLEGCFIATNQPFTEACGLPESSLPGKTDYDIWPKELAERYAADDREVIRSGKTKRVEEPLVNSQGIRSWIETVKVPILSDNGQVIGTAGIARDISERIQAESILRESHAGLERLIKERTADLEKLNAGLKNEVEAHRVARREREVLMKELERKNKELESVIYVTSHDLRSPLVNIQGFSKILERNYQEMLQMVVKEQKSEGAASGAFSALASKMSKNVHFITTSVYKMDALIDGLLRVSRLGLAELHVENIDLEQTLKSVVESMTYQIHQNGATVEIGSIPACRGDKMQIDQVFSNLLDNAIKYRDPARPLKIHVTGENRQDHAVICVEDNGIGIADEHQNKIWELFHRLNPNGHVSGEGLGLTMVRRMVDRNNGWVWVESAAGHGSRFYVALPCAFP